MTHAEHADHQTPLNLGDALKVAFRVVAHGGDDGQHQEQVHRDKEREDVCEVEVNQCVLSGDRQIERHHQHPMVGVPNRSQRDEFSQQEEGENRKEHDQRGHAPPPSHRKDDDQPPSHAHARVGNGQTANGFRRGSAPLRPQSVDGACALQNDECGQNDQIAFLEADTESHHFLCLLYCCCARSITA